MDEAFIQHTEHDINHKNRNNKQQRESLKRLLELLNCSLKIYGNTGGHPEFTDCFIDALCGLTERKPRLQIEGDRGCGDLTKMIHTERTDSALNARDLIQWNQLFLS